MFIAILSVLSPLISACSRPDQTPFRVFYESKLTLNEENLSEITQLFRAMALPGENNYIDFSQGVTGSTGQRSIYITAEARDDTVLLLVNLPDRSFLRVSVVGRKRPSYLEEFARKIAEVRDRSARENNLN
jgi:hypothetical protein